MLFLLRTICPLLAGNRLRKINYRRWARTENLSMENLVVVVEYTHFREKNHNFVISIIRPGEQDELVIFHKSSPASDTKGIKNWKKNSYSSTVIKRIDYCTHDCDHWVGFPNIKRALLINHDRNLFSQMCALQFHLRHDSVESSDDDDGSP